jgi:hypothetical protein
MHSMPVSVNATNFPTWNLTVNDTAPIWAYVSRYFHLAGKLYSTQFSAARKTLLAIAVLGWSCMFTGSYCELPLTISLCSAINSVETSNRNFTAFQNVAKALNGTATATNNPSATSVPHSGAPSMHHGCLTLIVLSAALMAAFA